MKALRSISIACRLFLISIALLPTLMMVRASSIWRMNPTNGQWNTGGATSGTWSLTGSLNTGRFRHTATLLLNGPVLVQGGGGFFQQESGGRTPPSCSAVAG